MRLKNIIPVAILISLIICAATSFAKTETREVKVGGREGVYWSLQEDFREIVLKGLNVVPSELIVVDQITDEEYTLSGTGGKRVVIEKDERKGCRLYFNNRGNWLEFTIEITIHR